MDAPQTFRKSMNGFNREDVVHYLEFLNAKHTAQVNQMNADAETQTQKLLALQEAATTAAQQVTEMREKLVASESARQELEEKCRELQDQLDAKPRQEIQDPEKLEILQADLQKANQENDELRSRCEELQQQLDNAPAKPAQDNSEELSRLHAMLDNSAAENSSLRAQVADLEQQLALRPAAPTVADQELEAYRRAERAERVATQRANQTYQKVNLVLQNATGKIDTVSAELCQAADQFNQQLAQLQSSLSATKGAVSEAVNTMYALRPENEEQN